MLSLPSPDSCPDTCQAAAQTSFEDASAFPEITHRYPADTWPSPVNPLAEYLTAIALGDANALAKFYRATIFLVLARARARVAKEDAEEIANDVYLYVWRHPLDYDFTRGSVQAWLCIMTRNRAIDCLRRRRRFVGSLDDDHESSQVTILVNPTIAADTLLEQYEWEGAAGRVSSTLNPLRRKLLDLSFFQELSHQAIARTVGLPLGTIKSHLRRALHSLRENSLAYA